MSAWARRSADMSLLLYKFDSADDFPVLDSYTTARGVISSHVEDRGDGSVLRICLARHPDEVPDTVIVLALPLVAVDGEPERLELTVHGDGSRCRLSIDASDARGIGFSYSFGQVDFMGKRTCRADVCKPDEVWDECQHNHRPQVTPPIQLLRLRIHFNRSAAQASVGLVALSVTGNAHRGASGIAKRKDL
ncbi:MAG: hypothetical protein JSU63_21960 [Phycisphaerales bacterium]|nr:MAG: hypothetical protein JSU63_21960 [Phycisphaerales bacterium]